MTERIRSLLQRVSGAKGSTDPTLDEHRERLPRAGDLQALEREIASEIAYSLGRAASKLEGAIDVARATLRELDAACLTREQRRHLVARFNEERRLAERRLRDLMIQREALGFHRHAELHQFYPIPPRLASD